jgi:hypothetical protein
MSHLNPERLAALADDEPTAVEAEHLARCAVCAREREAHGRLLQLSLRERDRAGDVTEVPLTSWSSLATELREEGLIGHGRIEQAPGRPAVALGSRWWVRAAAAILLVAGGVVAARVTGGPATGTADTRSSAGPASGAQLVVQRPPFRSVDEAQTALVRADSMYRMATLYLAEHDTTTRQFRNSDVYRARLAALDAMAGVAQRATVEVPHDPVISQYYLSTQAAREATLRQLDNALPGGARLTSF